MFADRQDWYALMKVLKEKDASDVEMLTYGMTMINKTLNGVADQVLLNGCCLIIASGDSSR